MDNKVWSVKNADGTYSDNLNSTPMQDFLDWFGLIKVEQSYRVPSITCSVKTFFTFLGIRHHGKKLSSKKRCLRARELRNRVVIRRFKGKSCGK